MSGAASGLSMTWGGEALQLCAGGVVWPARATLFVADVHFGKATVLQRAGLAVPEGRDAGDLQRLLTLARRHRVRRLVLLGDLLHARLPPSAPFWAEWAALRELRSAFEWLAVIGNHDPAEGQSASLEGLRWVERWEEGPFVGTHEPAHIDGRFNLCGHVHPVVRLVQGRERLRLRAYWIRPQQLVLPAFGSLTGGFPVRARRGERLAVWQGDSVYALPDPVALHGPESVGKIRMQLEEDWR